MNSALELTHFVFDVSVIYERIIDDRVIDKLSDIVNPLRQACCVA